MSPVDLEDRARIERRYRAADLASYSRLSGQEAVPPFLPEPLIDALFSQLLGMTLPGIGTNYLKQQSVYHQRARIDETLVAEVEVTRLREDKHLVDLATTCRGKDDRLLCSGRALVYIRDVKQRQSV